MPLPSGALYLPARYTSEDLAQQADYQSQIDDYNAQYNQYKSALDAYNEAVKKYNEGPQTSPFTEVEPNAPAQPGFTQDEIDQFNEAAQQRAVRNRSMMTTALNVARNPEAYGFGGFGFADGGNPVVEGVGSLFSPEEQARQEQIAAAELQPDGSLPDVDSLRFTTPEEVDMGSYKHLQDLQDRFNYHMEAAQSPVSMIADFLPVQANPANRMAHAKDAEMYRGMIEDFKDKRARAIVNYEAYIQAGGMPLYVNTEKGAYFSGFPDALVNFRATNP